MSSTKPFSSQVSDFFSSVSSQPSRLFKDPDFRKQTLQNFRFQLLSFFWITVFSCAYSTVNFLIYTGNGKNSGQNGIWNNLFDAIDDYHNLIRGFIFIPLAFALLRVIFPKTFQKLGDYFFLASLGVYNMHTLSQILLGSCILTLVPHWISNLVGIPSRYEIYVWNPLNVPQILLMPYYFVQLIIGFWASTRFVNILKEEKLSFDVASAEKPQPNSL